MKRAVNREREEFNEEWEEKKIRLGFSLFHIYQMAWGSKRSNLNIATEFSASSACCPTDI